MGWWRSPAHLDQPAPELEQGAVPAEVRPLRGDPAPEQRWRSEELPRAVRAAGPLPRREWLPSGLIDTSWASSETVGESRSRRGTPLPTSSLLAVDPTSISSIPSRGLRPGTAIECPATASASVRWISVGGPGGLPRTRAVRGRGKLPRKASGEEDRSAGISSRWLAKGEESSVGSPAPRPSGPRAQGQASGWSGAPPPGLRPGDGHLPDDGPGPEPASPGIWGWKLPGRPAPLPQGAAAPRIAEGRCAGRR